MKTLCLRSMLGSASNNNNNNNNNNNDDDDDDDDDDDKYLRNRKHLPCFYRVIETRVEVWENEKCCGNTSRRQVFPQLFRVLPNLHECFYNSIETRRKCFLFLLENSPRKITKNEENLIVLFIIKT